MFNITKKCPYCGEKININAKKCPYCAEEINEFGTNSANTKKKLLFFSIWSKIKQCFTFLFVTKKKQFLIASCSLVFLIVFFYFLQNIFYGSEYKSIQNISNYNPEKNMLKASEIVNLTNKQQEDLLEFLKSNALQSHKDAIFINFLNNLRYYNRVIRTKTIEDINVENNGEPTITSGLTIKSIGTKGYNDSPKGFIILYPKTHLFFYNDDGENTYSTAINMTYLKDTFGKYLSPQYRDYLKIRAKEEKFLDYKGYYLDGYTAFSPREILDFILLWQNYLTKYPKSFFNKEIKETISLYTGSITSGTEYYDYQTGKLMPEIKKNIEEYLDKADKSTEEYKQVQDDYNWLKANDFMYVERDTLTTEEEEQIENLLEKYKKEEPKLEYTIVGGCDL